MTLDSPTRDCVSLSESQTPFIKILFLPQLGIPPTPFSQPTMELKVSFADYMYIVYYQLSVTCSQSRMEYEERVKKQAKEMAPNGLGWN